MIIDDEDEESKETQPAQEEAKEPAKQIEEPAKDCDSDSERDNYNSESDAESISDIEFDYEGNYYAILNDLYNGLPNEPYRFDFEFSMYNLKIHSWCPEGHFSRLQFYFIADKIPENKHYALVYQANALRGPNKIEFLDERPNLQEMFIDYLNKTLEYKNEYSRIVLKLDYCSNSSRQFNQEDMEELDFPKGSEPYSWRASEEAFGKHLSKNILRFLKESDADLERIYVEYDFDSRHHSEWKVISI